MSKHSNRLHELLNRNLFLGNETKRQLLEADENTITGILPELEAMDAEQTRVFKGAVQRNPDFFDDWSEAIERGQAT
ncbi:hypothetical protein [Cohaesibacter gelatinilyticus]|nr:hypothetical protein [Cohaesibacter gelatinilyticus]